MFENLLVEENDNILIAVSGGPDSMALLDSLRIERTKKPFKLSVAHVNHGLRNASDVEEEGVRDYCKKYDIPFYVKRLEGKNLTEEKARNLRYAFFDKLIEKYGFNKLFTAHHLNDQAETVLLNLLRGSGPVGLEGIKERRKEKNYEIVRPFLSETKVSMRKYCVEKNVPFFEDQTNEEDFFTRNFLRNTVFPLIEERFLNAQEKIVETSKLVRLSNRFTDSVITHYFDLWTKKTEFGIKIKSAFFKDTKAFLSTYDLDYLTDESIIFLKLSVIRKMIEEVGPLKDVTFLHTKKVLEFFESKDSGSIDLPGDLLAGIHSGYDEILDRRKLPPNFGNYRAGKINKEKTFIFPKDKKIISVKSKDNLNETFFRKREIGDKLKLKGFEKKLNRFLIDKKVPSYLRDSLILFIVDETIEKVFDGQSVLYSNSDSINVKTLSFNEIKL